jgi:hypothetical protein
VEWARREASDGGRKQEHSHRRHGGGRVRAVASRPAAGPAGPLMSASLRSYLAGFIVKQLLEEGYRLLPKLAAGFPHARARASVRGTVRDVNQKDKIAHLLTLPGAAGRFPCGRLMSRSVVPAAALQTVLLLCPFRWTATRAGPRPCTASTAPVPAVAI